MSRLVLGVNCVREALRAHGKRVRVLLERSASPTLAGLERMANAVGAQVTRGDRAQLDRLSRGVMHQGAAAEAPELTINSFASVLDAPLVVALDELQDPHNFGAVVRAAVALAGAPVLWGEHGSAPLSPAMFRSSAGAIEHAKLVRVGSLRSALGDMAANGAQVIGLDGNAERPLHAFDLTVPTVLVLGSEGAGLKRGVRAATTALARLPMSGRLDSLNASTAAAIALYEWARQRDAAGLLTPARHESREDEPSDSSEGADEPQTDE